MEQIRELNNSFKMELINDAYSDIPYPFQNSSFPCAIDFACGRGGDLHKFMHANYKHVTMIDKCNSSLKTASSRAKKIDKKKMKVDFFKRDVTKEKWFSDHYVDTVFINFALNQMLEDDNCIDTLFQNCVFSLKIGGIFTGIALDGYRVRELLDSKDFDENFLQLRRTEKNNQYVFCIKSENEDTYFEKNRLCYEYFMDFDVIATKAKQYGFSLVSWYHPFNSSAEDNASRVLNLNVIFKFKRTDENSSIDGYVTCYDVVKYFPIRFSKTFKPLLLLTEEGKYSSSRRYASQKLTNIVKGLNAFSLLDACACCGTDSFFVAVNIPTLRIHAVEKNERNSFALMHNAEVLKKSNVLVHPFTDVVDYLDDPNVFFDVIYFDLPWGGPKYKDTDKVRLFLNETISLKDIIDKYRNVKCKHLIFKTPTNLDFDVFSDYKNQKFPFFFRNVLKFFFVLV